jgi:hypothetical protein
MTVTTKSLLRARTGQAGTHAAQLVALCADMMALEAEAAQEGRLILRAAATEAGLDIQAFGWQAITLMELSNRPSRH